MYDPRKHNYYEKLMQLATQVQARPIGLSDVDIYHDDWCRIYQGGYCNCDPLLELRPPAEQN